MEPKPLDANKITRQELIAIFTRLDDALASETPERKQTLCVFGAAAVLLYGSDERQTQDIDVWRPASDVNDRVLEAMAARAGVDLNPTNMEPDRVYLQIVTEGIVTLPTYLPERGCWPDGRPSETLWQGHRLTIVAPPAAIVAAAKMVRAEPQDVEDVLYIMAKRSLKLTDIALAAKGFPGDARERAEENLVYLRVVTDDPLQSLAKARGGRGRDDD